MRTSFRISVLTALLLAFAAFGQATTRLLPTTLSAAISDSKARTMVVASATGFTADTTVAYIDRELVIIRSVNGTVIGIIRGQNGTKATPHASGAYVWVWTPGNVGPFFSSESQGSCTASNELYLPRINVESGVVSDCLGGKWVNGAPSGFSKFRVMSPDPGGVLYTGINTNGTTLGATTMYCTEVNLPHNKLLTGIGLLNGTTVGTDNHLVALYDSGGTLLANSDVAGAVAAGASDYQEYAFTSTFYAVGPARYFACAQTNGTTATVRMAVTGQASSVLTKGQTGITFGTLPALTVPTTFTTAVGPFVYLY